MYVCMHIQYVLYIYVCIVYIMYIYMYVCMCVSMYIYMYYVCRYIYIHIKVKWSRYRSGVTQREGRGIALLFFHDRGTRGGWVVSSTPRPHFTIGKVPVPILQEAGWAPGLVWTDETSRPNRDSIPDRPARSQSLYRLSYPAHIHTHTHITKSFWDHPLPLKLCIHFTSTYISYMFNPT